MESVDFGNEPNKYPNARTAYRTYIADWNTVYRDYHADGGTAPATGPSTAVRYTWYITPFLSKDASRLAALAVHWYNGSANTSPTCQDLLADPGSTIASVVSQASAFGLPGIINETNTCYGQGMPGVSNAYCSALWSADQTMNGLAAGLQGCTSTEPPTTRRLALHEWHWHSGDPGHEADVAPREEMTCAAAYAMGRNLFGPDPK